MNNQAKQFKPYLHSWAYFTSIYGAASMRWLQAPRRCARVLKCLPHAMVAVART